MFDQLSERLQDVFANFRGGRQLTEDNMEDALREVRRALLEADVSLRVIKAFISRVKDRAVGEDVMKSVEPSQQLIKIVRILLCYSAFRVPVKPLPPVNWV
jgi:signal recognition particle subunit SRP54